MELFDENVDVVMIFACDCNCLNKAGAIIWHGDRKLKQQHFINDKDGRLVFVSMYHRHGDRTVISHIRDNEKLEHKLWVPIVSKEYSPVRLGRENDLFVTDNQPNGDIFQWNNIGSRLQATHLIHKQYNHDPNGEIYINSRNPNCNESMTNVHTWDSHYHYPYLGQLTSKGVSQLIDLGRWVRQRYINQLGWLSPSYDNKNSKLYYISSNFARTIYSADSLLMGLYPLNTRSQHCQSDGSVPLHVDIGKTFLYANERICKRLKLKNKENRAWLRENKDGDKIELKQRLAQAFGRNASDLLWV